MGKTSIIRPIFGQRARKASGEGQSPPQELEVGNTFWLVLVSQKSYMVKLRVYQMKKVLTEVKKKKCQIPQNNANKKNKQMLLF